MKKQLNLSEEDYQRKLQYFDIVNYYRASYKKENEAYLVPERINVSKSGWVCWGAFTGRLSPGIKQYYEIKVLIYIFDNLLGNNKRHCCIFTKDELISYLDLISTEYGPFNYTLTQRINGYRLNISFPYGVTKRKILWILNLIRHIYEFPFNVFLKDALELKKIDQFANEHTANLLQVVASVSNISYIQGQSLGEINKELVSLEDVRECLSMSKKGWGRNVSSIYRVKLSKKHYYLPKEIELPTYGYISNMTLGYWLCSNQFKKERIAAYIDYYNKINNNEGH